MMMVISAQMCGACVSVGQTLSLGCIKPRYYSLMIQVYCGVPIFQIILQHLQSIFESSVATESRFAKTMAPQFPSIHSFFHREVSTAPKQPFHHDTGQPGDGFTAAEIEATLRPALPPWTPRGDYHDAGIGSLVPGPGCIHCVGRVANITEQESNGKGSLAATGCFKLIVKDDSGALLVEALFYHFIGDLVPEPNL